MKHAVLSALIATGGTWLLTALGAAVVVFFKHPNRRLMNLMLGFAAGVMIAASFWSLLQPAIEQAKAYLRIPAWAVAVSGFLAGAIFMFVSDKAVTYTQRRINASPDGATVAPADDSSRGSLSRVFLLVLSITLHNIPEGLAVGVAFGALANGYTPEMLMGAVTIAVGIGLQNFPEGAAVSLPLRREGCSRLRSFFIGQASGMVEPIAGVIGALLVVSIRSILPFALAFAAGAMILVAVHELIPESHSGEDSDSYFPTMGIIAGFAVMMLLDVAL